MMSKAKLVVNWRMSYTSLSICSSVWDTSASLASALELVQTYSTADSAAAEADPSSLKGPGENHAGTDFGVPTNRHAMIEVFTCRGRSTRTKF
jgi:hypothetical protein